MSKELRFGNMHSYGTSSGDWPFDPRSGPGGCAGRCDPDDGDYHLGDIDKLLDSGVSVIDVIGRINAIVRAETIRSRVF